MGMTKEEIDKQATELRDKLRGKRTGSDTTERSNNEASGSASNDPGNNPGNVAAKVGHGLQLVSGSGSTTGKRDGQPDNNAEQSGSSLRGTAPGYYGVGQTTGRSGENNGQSRSDGSKLQTSPATTARTGRAGRTRLGNLETDEEIPTRTFTETESSTARVSANDGGKAVKGSVKSDTKSKKSIKEIIVDPIPKETREGVVKAVISGTSTLLKEGKTLSLTESKTLQEPLKDALLDYATYADQALWKRQGNTNNVPIWSDMDEDEIGLLVDFMLKSGQRSPITARLVRNAVNTHDYVALYMMLAPRTVRTANIIRETTKVRGNKKNENSNRR